MEVEHFKPMSDAVTLHLLDALVRVLETPSCKEQHFAAACCITHLFDILSRPPVIYTGSDTPTEAYLNELRGRM
jgi:hypothetical protein